MIDFEFKPEGNAEYELVYTIGSPYPKSIICFWYARNFLGERKLIEHKEFELKEVSKDG